MRLVVDLQACQTESRDRGIGRYAMNLVQGIASELGDSDELIVTVDLGDDYCARAVRNELHRRKVNAKVVAYGYPVTRYSDSSPVVRQLAGQLRSRFYASLLPDALLICSMFETGSNYTTEIDWAALQHVPTAVVSHDLIPLLFPEQYLPDGHFHTNRYRCRLNDIRQFDLILSNSEATKRDSSTHLGVSEDRIAVIGAGFDMTLVCSHDKLDSQRYLHELGIVRPFVLMVGNGDWRKNTLGALEAFVDLPESLRNSHDLVLTQVGDDVRQALEEKYSHLRDHIRILGRVDDTTLALLYRECKVFYFPSFYEGFGFPVLEAMAFNAPVLSSNAGSLPEVVHDPRVLFDPGSHGEGGALLARALADEKFRNDIRRGAREHALGFTWKRTAHRAMDALRTLAATGKRKRAPSGASEQWPAAQDIILMVEALVEAGDQGERALEDGLRAIARGGKRRVLVDITEIIRLDARTGIQRVTRKFFEGLIMVANESNRFEVEPFCWTEGGILYARGFAREKLGVPCEGPDVPVQVQPSDLVFMLDSSWWSPERFDDFHACVHKAGGEVVWMVYDLIPIRFPETCDVGMDKAFETWLTHAVLSADGFICISEATRNDLESYMDGLINSDELRPWTRSAHLGCDLDSAPDRSPSDELRMLRATIGKRPYLMALGTLEPRKDYGTILDAFELLWTRGMDVALVIVGKQGWNVDALAERVNQHHEHGRRLFWLQGAEDGDVRHLLKNTAALIQASIWEGFGLPLIEAGSLGASLLASDIAVFHEIAGDSATYFPVGDAAALANAVITTVERKSAPRIVKISSRNWHEASLDLVEVLCVT